MRRLKRPTTIFVGHWRPSTSKSMMLIVPTFMLRSSTTIVLNVISPQSLTVFSDFALVLTFCSVDISEHTNRRLLVTERLHECYRYSRVILQRNLQLKQIVRMQPSRPTVPCAWRILCMVECNRVQPPPMLPTMPKIYIQTHYQSP